MDNELKIHNLEKEISNLKNKNFELKKDINLLKSLVFKGGADFTSENYCPFCGNFSIFQDFGNPPRHNVLCPHCRSLERHRQVYLLLKQRFSELLFEKDIKLLHFAPELPFYNLFKNQPNIDYFPVDLCPEIYEQANIEIRKKVNMEEIPYTNKMFDFIYNCHVLEHVPDDIKAMRELYRVLNDGGVCVTLVPLAITEKTFEDDSINTPELRLKHYGQSDHRRIYGLDFEKKLESVGFNVDVVYSGDLIKSDSERKLYKIEYDRIFVCTK